MSRFAPSFVHAAPTSPMSPMSRRGRPMRTTVLFEVHSLRRNGNWYIDSVQDDRGQALHEARDLLDRRHHRGVKVVQENCNDETDTSILRTIFTAEWGFDKPTYRRQKPDPPVRSAAPPRKKKGDSDFVRYIVILVLSVGGILLAVIGLIAFLITMFGGS